MARHRVGILISGRGSNMTALIAAARDPDFPAEIVVVISNRPGAGGLAVAADHGIATATVDHTHFPDRESFDAAIGTVLDGHGVELVCLAGFLRIFSDAFVETWHGRMLNIHPSLLPSFRGLHPSRQALAAGVCIHGCTVHFVVPELDSGPIVAQAALPVLAGDTEETLSARVLEQEHRLYPMGLRMVALGKVVMHSDAAVRFDADARRILGLSVTRRPSS